MTAPDITIPDEALEAAARAIYDILEGPIADQDYGRQVRQWQLAQSLARAACLAMLKSWPGMLDSWSVFEEERQIILPLTQEGGE